MSGKDWIRCTPEEAGVPSEALLQWLRPIKDRQLNMHGAMIVRGGKCLFEAYWKPLDESFMHRLYSCSKSFVSAAVGIAIGKGLLRLDDRCVDFFPERLKALQAPPHPWLAQMTVRDCLRMATCWSTGSAYSAQCHDWISTFFADEVTHAPGTVFNYCTAGTTMLCSIIKRVSGMQLTDLLRPVFDEIGMGDAFCVKAPEGNGEYVDWGGSGMVMTLRDFARFADLCMHYGIHNGKELIPESYMKEAVSLRIDNSISASEEVYGAGYGYQFWMLPQSGFAFYGMGGQYALCFPEKDLLVMTTGYEELGKADRSLIFDGLYRYILPSLSDAPLPADEKAYNALSEIAASLEMPHAPGRLKSDITSRVSGVWYRMDPNPMGLYSSCFTFTEKECTWEYENRTGFHAVRFGLGHNIEQEFPEKYCDVFIDQKSDHGYRSFCSAAFITPDTLRAEVRVCDIYLGQLRLNICFKDDTVSFLGIKHAEWFMDEFEGFASGFRE